MAQLWSGNKQLHYEAWIRERLGVIEVGLHFEADALTNARLLAAFRARERAIRRALGAEVRIEAWDKGWARVWEPVALVTLDRSFLEQVGARIASYVQALEPVFADGVLSIARHILQVSFLDQCRLAALSQPFERILKAEAETAAARKGQDFAHYAERIKVCTDAQLIDYLEPLVAEGINYFIFYLPRTGYDLSQMQRLAGQVIPHFRQS